MISLVSLGKLLTVAYCGLLNTFRGGRFVPDEALRGRNLYYAAPLLGLVAFAWHPWPVAIAFAAGFAFWACFAWGHLIGMGRFRPSDRPPGPVESACLNLAGGNPHVALFLRMLFAIPLGFALAYLLEHPSEIFAPLAFAAAAVFSYELGWTLAERIRRLEKAPVMIGEIGTGLAWGAWIVLSSAI